MGVFSDSLFQAQMGTQFESPYEAMYMQGGGWLQDSAYMSPAYMGNFRPQYGGPRGFGTDNLPPFSLSGALSAAIPNPFQDQSPYYINPLAYRDQALTDLSQRPGAAAMWAVQNVAAPLAMFAAASKFTSTSMPSWAPMTGAQRTAGSIGATMSRAPGMAQAWYRTNVTGTMSPSAYARYASMSAASAAKRAGQQSIGAFVGAQGGRMLGAGFGGAMGGVMGGVLGGAGRVLGFNSGLFSGAATGARLGGGMMAAGMGAIGAGVGAIAAPFLVASAGMEALQQGIFDPYIAAARGQQAVTANYSNVYTGSSRYGIAGTSREASARVGTALARAGTEDRAFGLEGQINMFDMAMTSGLLSGGATLDPEDIKKKVKEVSKQVQVIMSVAGDPDVRRAIQRLAEMKRMGISGSDASTTIQALGAAEAITGKSVMQIQATVGSQASYLFQQAGIGPQGAQAAAATAYAGFSNAYKMGLINPAQLALMGGAEGATQSLLTGQIGLGRSMYNQIVLANRFMFGQEGNGVVSSLSNFGSNVAGNPLAAMGALRMNSAAMMGAQMQENPLGPTKGIFDRLNLLPSELTRGKNGNVRWDSFAAVGLQSGMGEDQMRALLEQMRGLQDPGAIGRMRMASIASTRGQYASYLDVNGLDYAQGPGMIAGIGRGFHNLGISLSRFQGEIVGDFGGVRTAVGRATDVLGETLLGSYTSAGSAKILTSSMEDFIKTGTVSYKKYDLTDPNAGLLSKLRSTESVLRKVEERLNTGGISSERLKEIQSMKSESAKLNALKSEVGLSSREARQFLRTNPNLETITSRGSFDIKGAANEIARSIRAGNASDAYRLPGLYKYSPLSLLSSRLRYEAGMLTTDDIVKDNMTNEELYMALGTLNNSLSDRSVLEQIFTEGENDTASNAATRKFIELSSGMKKGTLTLSDVENMLDDEKSFLRNIGDRLTRIVGENPEARAVFDAAKENLSSISDPRKVKGIMADAAARRAAAAKTGLNEVFVSTPENLNKLGDIERSFFEHQTQIEKMAATGKLDFTGYMEASSANQLSSAANRFQQAVEVFARAVAEDTGTSLSAFNLSTKAEK